MVSLYSTTNISANIFQNIVIMLQYIGFLLIMILFFITIYFKKYIKERYLWITKLNNEKHKYDDIYISTFDMANEYM